VLKTLDFIRVINRSFYIQATWNPERMLSLGYCFSLVPFIKKVFSNASDRIEFLKKNQDFFNTHPCMATFVMGSVIKLEEEHQEKGAPGKEQISRFKKRLSESLAATGDQLFWAKIKPLAAMFGLGVALFAKTLGLGVFLLCYNVPQLYARGVGLFKGYKHGFELTKKMTLGHSRKTAERLDRLAAFGSGALLVTLGFSNYVSGTTEMVAFLASIVVMLGFLKIKMPIPLALIILIVASTIVSGFIH
ncbi:MAG: PTS system mannose/fructose/sorbose family transporter subunit IID, partial [bacterium]